MSRFLKLAQTIWHCQYHIVWVPKYRYKILTGKLGQEFERCIRAFLKQQGCSIIKLNVQVDHVHPVGNGSSKSIDFWVYGDFERANSHKGVK